MPSSLVAETCRISIAGLMRRAFSRQRARSKRRCGSRSTLFSSISDAAANMSGYLSGLSSPSVTDSTTTLCASPRSKPAGQTRLPTFSIISTESGAGASRASAVSTSAASRWHPLPVLICSAGAPVARMRSASFEVCWSPSTTATGSRPASSSIVRTSSVVLPEPGLDTRLSAKMPRSASVARLRCAWPSFLASTSRSICTMRAWLMPGTVAPAAPAPKCSSAAASWPCSCSCSCSCPGAWPCA